MSVVPAADSEQDGGWVSGCLVSLGITVALTYGYLSEWWEDRKSHSESALEQQ